MGDRNHLHVCRHCGNVMATSSEIGPQHCSDCQEDNFSLFLVLPETVVEPVEGMAITWRLYGEFARTAGMKEMRVPVNGAAGSSPTVRDAVHALVDEQPALRPMVLTDHDEIRGNGVIVHNHVNVYSEQDHLDTRVKPRDTLGLFPRIT